MSIFSLEVATSNIFGGVFDVNSNSRFDFEFLSISSNIKLIFWLGLSHSSRKAVAHFAKCETEA